MTNDGHYQVHIHWSYIEKWLEAQAELGLDLDPDFQRGHVWTEEQQTRFVEYCLRGGRDSSIIRFNCVGWQRTYEGPFVLVDGKQRLEAVRKFLRNDLKAFGHTIDEYEDKLIFLREQTIIVRVNDLPNRKAVLQWYLDINTGGVVHTSEEINKVIDLLKAEK